LDFNENENTTYQNLWDTAKIDLMGKFIAMSSYLKNTERSQINDLMLHVKFLEKEHTKPKKGQKRNNNKIRAKINEIEYKKTIQRYIETKRWFLEKTNKIDKLLASLTKMT
jgi:hypothetical protein